MVLIPCILGHSNSETTGANLLKTSLGRSVLRCCNMGLKPCTITKLELLKVAVRKTLLSDNVHISTDIVLQCYSTRAKIPTTNTTW